MATKYPASIDTNATLKPIVNGQPIAASSVEQLRMAIIAIEEELGVKPSGVYTTVRGRLDTLEGIIGDLRIIEINGDLGGTISDPRVIGIHGRPISTATPHPGDVYVWDGIAWSPGTQPADVHFAGDIAGNPETQQVVGINTIPVRVAKQAEFNNDAGNYLRAEYAFSVPIGLAFDGTSLWVSNAGNDDVVRVDTSTPSVEKVIILPNTYSCGQLCVDSTHVFVTSLGFNQIGASAFTTGHVFIIESATNNIVGRIEATNLGDQFFNVAVNGDDVFVITGLGGSADDNTRVEKFSKTALLAAYPNSVAPVQTLPASPGNAYLSGMCFGGGFLFVTSGGLEGGALYKIDPSNMTIVQTFTEDSPGLGIAAYCTFAFGSVWLTGTHESSPGVQRFDPADISSAISFIPVAAVSYITSDTSTIWVTDGSSGNVLYRISTDLGSEAVIATVGQSPYSFTNIAFDGVRIWAGGNAGYAGGIHSFSTGLGTEAWIQFFGGQLTIKYEAITIPSTGIDFLNNGSDVGTYSGLNIVSGGTFTTGPYGVDLTINGGGLPPPGNVYDYIRLVPNGIFNQPQGLWFDRDTTMLWVTNANSNQVQKLDVSTGTPNLNATITLPFVNHGWKITGDSSYVYVTSNTDGYVFVIDKFSATVIGAGFIGGTVTALTIDGPIDVAGNPVGTSTNLWVISKDGGGGGQVHKFLINDMIANYPTAIFASVSADVPNGTSDWEDMCFVGGEGGFLVTGSSGWIYQFSSPDDGFSTVFADYGNPPFYYGIQLGGITPIHQHDISHSLGQYLWTTSLGSESIQAFYWQNLSDGGPGPIPSTVMGLNDFTGDIISDGSQNADLWINNNSGTIWRVTTQNGIPTLAATISVPALSLNGVPFMGMAYDPVNSFVWMADPGHNAIISTSTNTNTYIDSWAGPFTAQWFKGDIVYDNPVVRSNLRSTKSDQSPIDNSKIGQLNLSSTNDAGSFPGTGGNYSMILGGLNNAASFDHDIIVGGYSNQIVGYPGSQPTVSVIGGGSDNQIHGNGKWDTIAGGEGSFIYNSTGGTISGGRSNTVYTDYATIGGGQGNIVGGASGTVAGGSNNQANGDYSTVSGGQLNVITQIRGVICGGDSNTVSAPSAVIVGGENNTANGDHSIILGGISGNTSRYGQMAHSGVNGFGSGFAQFCRYSVFGNGQDADGTFTLLDSSGSSFRLDANQTYNIRATVVINRTDGNPARAWFVYNIYAYCINNGPVANIVAANLIDSAVFAGAGETISFDTTDDSIVATVHSAVDGSNALLTYEWTEIGGSTDDNT